MYLVEDLFKRHGERLGLELIAGKEGMRRAIKVPEAHRPGLSLSGYLKSHAGKRILIFGKVEMEYLRDLEPHERIQRLEGNPLYANPSSHYCTQISSPQGIDKSLRKISTPLISC
jgi:HPr kinase/phosphorylase